MYCPNLHKWIDRLSNIGKLLRGAFTWLLAPQRIVIFCFLIALVGVSFEYGPDLPGCGGPPLPTPPATVPATATVPPSATPEPTVTPTPEPTPTLPLSPVSPLGTPGAGE